jgi:hypothetical protein
MAGTIDTGVVTNGLIIAYLWRLLFKKKATLINVLTPAFRQTLIEIKK